MDDRGAGWLTFASIILIFAGLMRILDAIWAFSYGGATPLHDALLGDTLDNYGWWWLLVGVLLILAGFAVLYGSQMGRWLGIIAAVVGGLSAMTWIWYTPIWSMVYVIIAVLVLYALIVYGGVEMPSM